MPIVWIDKSIKALGDREVALYEQGDDARSQHREQLTPQALFAVQAAPQRGHKAFGCKIIYGEDRYKGFDERCGWI